MPAREYTVDVITDAGLTVERRRVAVSGGSPHGNVLQAVTGALAALRQDMQLPPVAVAPESWDGVTGQVRVLTTIMRDLCAAGAVPADADLTALADLEEQAEDAHDLFLAARRQRRYEARQAERTPASR
jgi:hypothetical protein